MFTRNIKRKTWCLLLLMCMVTQMMCIPVFAQDTSSKITTTVKITDLSTGEVKQYEIDDARSIAEVDEEGRPVTTTIIEVGGSQSDMARAGQSNYDDFSGWRGTVTISYTDNGTYANLTKATGNWTRRSGSTSISGMSMTYGQALGTNSRNSSIGLSSNSTTTVTPSWPAGKYGYGIGHYLGATIHATIGGKYVYISCNVNY